MWLNSLLHSQTARIFTQWQLSLISSSHLFACILGANVQKGKHLETPLHAAAQHSSTEIVNLLLEFGADINAKNTDFERPVDLAAPRSLVERLLLLHEGKLYICFCKCTFVNKHVTKNPNNWICLLSAKFLF